MEYLCLCKELQIFRVLIAVEGGDFLILPLPKLLEQPRFFHLTYPCKIRGVRKGEFFQSIKDCTALRFMVTSYRADVGGKSVKIT